MAWCIKGTDESTVGKDLSVSLMHHDPSDIGSLILIRIIPKRTHSKLLEMSVHLFHSAVLVETGLLNIKWRYIANVLEIQ